MPVVTLLTDWGLDDYYVAAVKGTLIRLVPGCTPVDIAHTLAPGDVEGGAFLLAAAAPSFPAGTVHCAVVDPGVGSGRRRLGVACRGQFFVGPDNGLLTPWFDGGEVRTVESLPLDLLAPGETFHGRDRFAPLAAALLLGTPFTSLGSPLADPVRLDLPRPTRTGDGLRGRIVHTDRFGNLVTDIPSSWLPPGSSFTVAIDGPTPLLVERLVSCYAELPPGIPGVVPGSLGTLELSLRGASLAARCGSPRGAAVTVRFR